MPIVEIPNVGQVEFPESMSAGDIAAAAKRLHAGASVQVSGPAPVEEALTPGKFIAGLGDTAKNMGRMAVKGVAALPGMILDPLLAVQNKIDDLRLGEGVGDRQQTSSSRIENLLSNLGMTAPNSAAGRVAEDMGSAMVGAGGVAGLAQKGASALAPLTTAERVAQVMAQRPGLQITSAATGAGSAGTAREVGGGPIAQILAGLAGGVAPSVASAAGAPIGRLVENLRAPYNQEGRDASKATLLKELIGQKTPDVIAALENQRPRVPGMTYNAALAAEPAGSTELAALQKALDSRFNPTGANDLALGNAQARQAALGKISGTSADLEAAQSLRADTAKMTYGAAKAVPVAVDSALAALAKNPFIKQAIQESADLSKSQGLSWKNPKDVTQLVQNAKFGLDKMLSGQASTTLGAAEKQAAVQAQKDLISWLEAKNPQYQVARENFAQQSRPINRMEIGKVLSEKLGAPLNDAERAGVFAQAVRDAPRTMKTATGENRYSELGQVLLPRDVKSVEGVQSELARLLSTQKQAQAGESSVRETVRGAFAPIEPPGILHRGITVLRAVLERAQSGTSKKTLAELSQDMQDPGKIRALLQTMPLADAEALSAVIKQMGVSGALGTAAGLQTVKE